MKRGLTFVIARLPGRDGVFLCTENADATVLRPLAQFVGDEERAVFTETLALARAVSHAQGQMGI